MRDQRENWENKSRDNQERDNIRTEARVVVTVDIRG
jgi:hypothetical protein